MRPALAAGPAGAGHEAGVLFVYLPAVTVAVQSTAAAASLPVGPPGRRLPGRGAAALRFSLRTAGVALRQGPEDSFVCIKLLANALLARPFGCHSASLRITCRLA